MIRAALLMSVALIAACGETPAGPPPPVRHATVKASGPVVEPLHFPFAANSATPYVAAAKDGGFVLSWSNNDSRSLNFATYRDGRWFQPRTIVPRDLLINKSDMPTIAGDGAGVLAASWATAKDHGRTIHIARSANDGATWGEPQTPHPLIASEFGFVSLAAGSDGTLHAVWLDGRKLRGGREGEGDMELRYATAGKDGRMTESVQLDDRVCDCCQTAMAMTDDGPVVAYRDRTQDEVRDIAVVRGTASGWTKPVVVHDDGWRLPGCPVNGPQLDALHRDVVVAWFTAASGKGRVYCAFSNDAAASFGPALQVDEGHAMGRVDVGMLADGSAVVTWIEAEENDAAVVARRVSRDGHHGALLRLGAAPASSTIGVPRLAASKQSVLVAWNGEKSIEIATIELPKE